MLCDDQSLEIFDLRIMKVGMMENYFPWLNATSSASKYAKRFLLYDYNNYDSLMFCVKKFIS